MARSWLRSAFGIVVAACVAPAAGLPPPRATPQGAAATRPAAARCGLVHRAPRTFIGLGEGLTLEDMADATVAALAVVLALDEALCPLLGHERAAGAAPARYQPLASAIEAGASLEVTQIMLAGTGCSSATADLQATPVGAGLAPWQASLELRQQTWFVTAFKPVPRH